MGLGNSERIDPGQDRRGIIVAGGASWRGVAVAVARIIERDRAARAAEMIELRVPHGFVRADALEEHDRRRRASAAFHIAQRLAVADREAGHHSILAAR